MLGHVCNDLFLDAACTWFGDFVDEVLELPGSIFIHGMANPPVGQHCETIARRALAGKICKPFGRAIVPDYQTEQHQTPQLRAV